METYKVLKEQEKTLRNLKKKTLKEMDKEMDLKIAQI